MNIIKMRQMQRLEKIKLIRDYLSFYKEPDYHKLIMELCAEWGVTEKYLKELLEIAKFQIEKEKRENGSH